MQSNRKRIFLEYSCPSSARAASYIARLGFEQDVSALFCWVVWMSANGRGRPAQKCFITTEHYPGTASWLLWVLCSDCFGDNIPLRRLWSPFAFAWEPFGFSVFDYKCQSYLGEHMLSVLIGFLCNFNRQCSLDVWHRLHGEDYGV